MGVSTVICQQNIEELPQHVGMAARPEHRALFRNDHAAGRRQGQRMLSTSIRSRRRSFSRRSPNSTGTKYGHHWDPRPPLVGGDCLRHQFSCAVNSEGYVQPCVGVTIPIGNVRKQKLKDILQDSEVVQDLKSYKTMIKGPCSDMREARRMLRLPGRRIPADRRLPRFGPALLEEHGPARRHNVPAGGCGTARSPQASHAPHRPSAGGEGTGVGFRDDRAKDIDLRRRRRKARRCVLSGDHFPGHCSAWKVSASWEAAIRSQEGFLLGDQETGDPGHVPVSATPSGFRCLRSRKYGDFGIVTGRGTGTGNADRPRRGKGLAERQRHGEQVMIVCSRLIACISLGRSCVS